FVFFCRSVCSANLAKCLIINVLRLIIVILFFIAFLNITYLARHTWATLAKYCQVPEEVISEGLGHSSLEVTRTYLKSFEGEELNRANIVVNNYIITGEKRMWNEA
ncbi:integrase, partial [Bacteroides sp.]|uniref:integrase n=1 Tax=Bacteroides sp. TaxID=29523 RepID=UPI003AAA85B4